MDHIGIASIDVEADVQYYYVDILLTPRGILERTMPMRWNRVMKLPPRESSLLIASGGMASGTLKSALPVVSRLNTNKYYSIAHSFQKAKEKRFCMGLRLSSNLQVK